MRCSHLVNRRDDSLGEYPTVKSGDIYFADLFAMNMNPDASEHLRDEVKTSAKCVHASFVPCECVRHHTFHISCTEAMEAREEAQRALYSPEMIDEDDE
jgi:hypothetical protein